ncbi:class II aldolase/adducin family protein [Candidatus Sumerlaeota bacterium]|nr:class II aldolase/adducin family protein [Candidatus Sumerlaeota bacterium]
MAMTEWQAKEFLCEIGRRVWIRNFCAANEGNFSFRIDDDRVLATPTLQSKGFLKPEDIVTLDMKGKQIGGIKKPTSETLLHLGIYERRPDVRAVIHAHPPCATAFAVVKQPIPKCVLPEVEIFVGEIPIVEYATPGTQELADSLKPFLSDFTAFLLANHGALTIGKDIEDAYFKLEIVEEYCRVLLYTRQLDGYVQMTDEKVGELLKIKEKLGIPDRRLKPGACATCAIPAPAPQEHDILKMERSDIENVVRQVLQEKGLL